MVRNGNNKSGDVTDNGFENA